MTPQSKNMEYDVPIVSARYGRKFARFMENKGVGRQALLEGCDFGEDTIDNPDAFLSTNQVIQMLSQADSLVRDERIPFQFGQQLNLMAHGLMGFALLGQQDHRKLINMIVQYLRVCLPLIDLEAVTTTDSVCLRLRDNWDLGSLHAFVSKIYMGSIHALSAPVCRHFIFECDFSSNLSSASWRAIAEHSEMRFDCPYNQVLMPLSGRAAGTEAVGLASSFAEDWVRQQTHSDSASEIVTQVREYIINNPGRRSALENTARHLGMSGRSIRNHLAQSGVSFRELRSEIRQTFATLYLKDTSVSMEVIADRLGFSDQASFTRAYRSWTGETPGEVRRKNKNQP